MATPDDPDARLADLLAAYDDALAAGAAPPHHPSPWRHLDPASQARLDDDRSVLDQLERLWPRGTPSRPAAPVPETALPFDFGRFRAHRKLGAGGCGVVFLADDPVLGRPVALKVPRPDVLGSPDLSRRFLREARTAALLAHPNIVPVYEASAAGGVCYIAAEFCPGPTLAGWLADRPPPTPRAAAHLAAALAEAMGYAHRRGVVHRDLKPSNVLLFGAGSDGVTGLPPDPDAALDELVPKVTDFGFAKLLERDDEATRPGTVIGTPQYMAPEQAEGRLTAVGPATDVYALGAILYECLTGRPPIKGATDADTLRQLVYVEPKRPRALRPDCPRDLEAVCLKCLEKSPLKRYPDAAALADELQRFLAGEPTRARPLGPGERAAKWARRHPLGAALAAVVVLAVAGIGALGAAFNRDLTEQNAALEAALTREKEQAAELARQRQLADDRAAAARRQAYLAEVRYLGGLAGAGRVYELAAAFDPAVGDDLGGFEWRYLTRLARAARVWRGFPGPVDRVALSADGRRAAAYTGGEVRLWDVADGRVLAHWGEVPGAAHLLGLAPDGRTVVVLDAPPGGPARPGLVVLGVDPGLRQVLGPTHDAAPSVAGFLADGRLLVPHGTGFGVADVRTGGRAAAFARDGWKVWSAGAAADGSVLAATLRRADADVFQAVVFDPATGRATDLPGATDPYSQTRVSPDGRHVALLRESEQQDVRVWDRLGGREVAVLRFEGLGVNEVRFLADGRLAAAGWQTGDAAGAVWVGTWDPADRRWSPRRVEPGCKVSSVAVSSDGRRLLIGGVDHTARVVELDPPERQGGWVAHGTFEAWAVAFSPDGKTIVTGGDDWAVNVWDARTGARVGGGKEHGSLVTAVAFAPDGRSFASAGYDRAVKIWDAATRTVRRTLDHGGQLRAVAFSPDGAWVAAGGRGGETRVWEAATGRLVYAAASDTTVRAVVFAGRTLVTGDGRGVRWWDGAGRPVRFVPDANTPGAMALTPDGRTLVVATETGQVVFRDAASGAERFRQSGPPNRMTSVAVAPDGKTVATGGLGGAVRLWHAGTGDELFPLTDSGPQVHGVAFAPDGTRLAAARHDGRLLLWTTLP